MTTHSHPQHRHTTATPLLFGAAVALYAAGPLLAPSGLQDLYELDTLAQKYAAVAADTAAYRWANLAAAAAAVAGAAGVYRLTRAAKAPNPNTMERLAPFGLLAAVAGWVALAALRVLLVSARADDVADGEVADAGTIADAALRGDGPFIAFTVLAGAALVALAVTWWRSRAMHRVAVTLIGLGGITTALLARSDPTAIVFTPLFPFVLAFLPLAIVTARRPRTTPPAEPPATVAVGR